MKVQIQMNIKFSLYTAAQYQSTKKKKKHGWDLNKDCGFGGGGRTQIYRLQRNSVTFILGFTQYFTMWPYTEQYRLSLFQGFDLAAIRPWSMLWMEKGGKLHLSTLGGTAIQSTATEGGNKLKSWGGLNKRLKD